MRPQESGAGRATMFRGSLIVPGHGSLSKSSRASGEYSEVDAFLAMSEHRFLSRGSAIGITASQLVNQILPKSGVTNFALQTSICGRGELDIQ